MSNNRSSLHFSFDESLDLVRGEIRFAEKHGFSISVATPVPKGENHWKVLANALVEVGQPLFSIADTLENRPEDRITFAR
jgi:hypothetical protein